MSREEMERRENALKHAMLGMTSQHRLTGSYPLQQFQAHQWRLQDPYVHLNHVSTALDSISNLKNFQSMF